MSYSLLDWVDFSQIFIPKRLELLKTHHCALLFGPLEYITNKKLAEDFSLNRGILKQLARIFI